MIDNSILLSFSNEVFIEGFPIFHSNLPFQSAFPHPQSPVCHLSSFFLSASRMPNSEFKTLPSVLCPLSSDFCKEKAAGFPRTASLANEFMVTILFAGFFRLAGFLRLDGFLGLADQRWIRHQGQFFISLVKLLDKQRMQSFGFLRVGPLQ